MLQACRAAGGQEQGAGSPFESLRCTRSQPRREAHADTAQHHRLGQGGRTSSPVRNPKLGGPLEHSSGLTQGTSQPFAPWLCSVRPHSYPSSQQPWAGTDWLQLTGAGGRCLCPATCRKVNNLPGPCSSSCPAPERAGPRTKGTAPLHRPLRQLAVDQARGAHGGSTLSPGAVQLGCPKAAGIGRVSLRPSSAPGPAQPAPPNTASTSAAGQEARCKWGQAGGPEAAATVCVHQIYKKTRGSGLGPPPWGAGTLHLCGTQVAVHAGARLGKGSGGAPARRLRRGRDTQGACPALGAFWLRGHLRSNSASKLSTWRACRCPHPLARAGCPQPRGVGSKQLRAAACTAGGADGGPGMRLQAPASALERWSWSGQ
ncbi:uncharacterized protein LOC142003854 [Carettochelys insculpta]|uniref:uncharacterized protein LOC142003854 n=1 Tax=Carettochelys insculpta TaxID=44489 RepID=UPI003EBF706A